jgi:hypothetical protein
MTNNEVVNVVLLFAIHTKSASISHVNSQGLVLADYDVKTGYCQLYAELICCVFQSKYFQPH